MKAAVLKGKRNVVVEEVPTPTAGPDEIVVKVKYAGICGTDLHLYKIGMAPPDTIMGHECSGVVAEVGEGVRGWSVGDRVGIDPILTCGECFWCERGQTNACPKISGIGVGDMPGGYAEFVKVPPSMLVRIPDEVILRDAALLDPFSTAFHAVRVADFQTGDTALVVGAGPIGLCVIDQLRLTGARLIGATELAERRAQAAKEIGADYVMSPTDDVLGKMSELTNGIGVDYVFECVGSPEATQEAFNLVRRVGKVVLVGMCVEPATVAPFTWVIKEVSMQTSMGFVRSEYEGSLDSIRRGLLKTDALVSEPVSLDQLPEVIERLLSPNTELKVLVEFDD